VEGPGRLCPVMNARLGRARKGIPMPTFVNILTGVVITAILMAAEAFGGGEIYGTIHTTRGETLTGPIRWDRNENFWDDELNASKRERIKQEEEGGEGVVG